MCLVNKYLSFVAYPHGDIITNDTVKLQIKQ